MLQKIPPQYRQEFLRDQIGLIRSRVRLSCLMTLAIYFCLSIISIVFYPQDFRPQELSASIGLFAGGLIILFLNRKARSLGTATLNAYLYTFLLLAVITRLAIVYYDYAAYSAAYYMFILFLVVFTIPWPPRKVLAIAAMHLAAYSSFFLYIKAFAPHTLKGAWGQHYFEGCIMIGTAAALAYVVRKKEDQADTESFVLLKEIEGKNAQMQRELEVATQVHKTLVPKSVSTDLVDIAVMYLPVSFLGGDYARFHFIGKDRLIFIISDVTGHGVSAALLVNRFHAEFERLAKEDRDPGVLLEELNDFIVEDFEGTNMYLSAFCGSLDFSSRKFVYSNHGHPTQYLYRVRDSKILGCSSQATLLGLPGKERAVRQHEMEFVPRDKIMLFTDGVIETMNAQREAYGEERLEDFIKSHIRLGVDAFNRELLGDLRAFKGGKEEFRDDIFLLTIEIK